MAKVEKEADRHAEQGAQEGAQEGAKTEEAVDVSEGKYGKLEVIQSKDEEWKRDKITPCNLVLVGTGIGLMRHDDLHFWCGL
jgi:hypothetical protein